MTFSFNPCFSGSCSRIYTCVSLLHYTYSFNPCFSGSCSRMRLLLRCLLLSHCVSILVLVDLARELPLFNFKGVSAIVSILVLVDLARESQAHIRKQEQKPSFNPCFSGSCSRILLLFHIRRRLFCFNPCFSGSCSRMAASMFLKHFSHVSILVLVDLARELYVHLLDR